MQHYEKEVEQLEYIASKDSCRKRRFNQSSLEEDDSDEDDHKTRQRQQQQQRLKERGSKIKEIKRRRYDRSADMFLMSQTPNGPSILRSMENNNVTTSTLPNSTTLNANTTNANTNATNANHSTTSESSYVILTCPVCNKSMEKSEHSTRRHIARCLAWKDGCCDVYSSEEEDNDCDFEEYTWAGQTRIRTVTLLEENFDSYEGKTMKIVMDDGDEELDVDGEADYGAQQYLFSCLFS